MAINDDLRAFYISSGAQGTSIQDLENSWVKIQTGSSGSHGDLWKKHLETQGYSGAIPDMRKNLNYPQSRKGK